MKTITVKKGKSFAALLGRLNAYADVRAWVGKKSLRTAYRLCAYPDEILWLAGRLDVPRPVLVLAAAECARLVEHLVSPGEDSPWVAVEIAERWAHGDPSVSLDTVQAVADDAAYVAAYVAADVAAQAATDAATAAAYAAVYAAAYTAIDVAHFAANAAYAAADAAAYAAGDARSARAEMRAKCVEIVKRHVTLEMLESAIKKM